MSAIVPASTIVCRLSHLFEQWRLEVDKPLVESGYLKPEYSKSDFSVGICVAEGFGQQWGDYPPTEVKLTVNRQRWIEEDYDNFLSIDAIEGWCHWMTEKLNDPEALAFAFELTNQIRLALSKPPLTEFKEDELDLGFTYN